MNQNLSDITFYIKTIEQRNHDQFKSSSSTVLLMKKKNLLSFEVFLNLETDPNTQIYVNRHLIGQ